MTRKQKRELICRIIEDVIYLYVMGAGIWVVCRLVGEIFTKMGVG